MDIGSLPFFKIQFYAIFNSETIQAIKLSTEAKTYKSKQAIKVISFFFFFCPFLKVQSGGVCRIIPPCKVYYNDSLLHRAPVMNHIFHQ